MSQAALILQQPAAPAGQLVLLLHGQGADAADLQPLGERLAAEFPQALVVSLRAPYPAGDGIGYQWITPAGLDDALRIERVAAEVPALHATVRHWQQVSGLGPEATLLVGFSQGAMMVLEASTQSRTSALAGRVVALAGRYAQLPAANPAGTTLFLVHGTADAVVDHGYTVDAASHLLALGADVVVDLIPSLGHEIDTAVLDLLVRRLRTHVPRRHWEADLRQGVAPEGRGTQ